MGSQTYNFIRLLIVVSLAFFSSLLFQMVWYFPLIVLLFVLAGVLYLKSKRLFFFVLLLFIPVDRFYLPVFFRLKIYHILVVAASLFEFSQILLKKKRVLISFNRLDFIVLAIFLARILSIFITVDYFSTIKALILYALFLMLYFYIRGLEREVETEAAVQFMILSGLFYVVFAVVELVLGKIGVVNIQTTDAIYVYGGRPSSVFREPDWFGGYLVFILGITFPFLSARMAKRSVKFLNVFVYCIALVVFLLIVVRSAWLGLFLGVVFILIISNESRPLVVRSALMTGVFLSVLVFFMWCLSGSHFKSVHDRFFSFYNSVVGGYVDPAVQVRLNSYATITKYIEQNPVFGYGAGSWEYLSQRHEHVNPSLSANNIFLTPILEMGFLGVLLYLLFIFFLITLVIRTVHLSVKSTEFPYAIGFTIAIFGALIVSIFNDIMLTGFFWGFLALFVNLYSSLQREKGC